MVNRAAVEEVSSIDCDSIAFKHGQWAFDQGKKTSDCQYKTWQRADWLAGFYNRRILRKFERTFKKYNVTW